MIMWHILIINKYTVYFEVFSFKKLSQFSHFNILFNIKIISYEVTQFISTQYMYSNQTSTCRQFPRIETRNVQTKKNEVLRRYARRTITEKKLAISASLLS